MWQALHFVSVGSAIGAAALVGKLVDSPAAWLLGGLLATVLYFGVVGVQLLLGPSGRDEPYPAVPAPADTRAETR